MPLVLRLLGERAIDVLPTHTTDELGPCPFWKGRNGSIPRAIHQRDGNLEFLDQPDGGVETVLHREIELEVTDLVEAKRRQRLPIPIRTLPLVQMMKGVVSQTVPLEPSK